MKRRNHLPVCGVGPAYGFVVIVLTAAGVGMSGAGRLPAARAEFAGAPMAGVGVLLIASGAWLWYCAVFRARVGEHIRNNTLVTDGVYAWVRNPIYSAILMACTGALLLANNLWLLALPPAYWLFLTVLMKWTEERWLSDRYGREYAEYCRRVNRCIPWPPRRSRA